jgi:hypothetical protein
VRKPKSWKAETVSTGSKFWKSVFFRFCALSAYFVLVHGPKKFGAHRNWPAKSAPILKYNSKKGSMDPLNDIVEFSETQHNTQYAR